MLEITKDEAIQLVHKYSWAEEGEETCGHPGCEDHRAEGRRMIHTYSSFGCNLTVDDVVEGIQSARAVGWIDHLLRHDLAIVQDNGRVLCIDVPRPADVEP